MFTGIIETQAKLVKRVAEGSNVHFHFSSSITDELKIDQSIAHNGVCLTVVSINSPVYVVTAIDETLKRTNLGLLKEGNMVNLERCMVAGGRLDGHIVQGHVDQTASVTGIENLDGSWKFYFEYEPTEGNITVEKGSITINGTSLTVVDSKPGAFSVAIIPYTFEHTNFNQLKVGDVVNIEFDILGKYIANYLKQIYPTTVTEK